MTALMSMMSDGMATGPQTDHSDEQTMQKRGAIVPVNDELRQRKRKAVERILLAIAVIGTALAIMMYSNLFSRIADRLLPPKSDVYGLWVEQHVAPYAAKKIRLDAKGVVIEGRVVATSFDFNGRTLEYTIGTREFQYRMLNEENTEMQRVKPASHYNPTFQLSGKHQKNLR
ncbi:DUF2850 domain-containing protein [Vibrio furnissii]|uniref:DUF2850 domain-containing protein n=1 Tax=Vibrio furnissii TaxID=29494 RepID=UPI000A65E8F4|nr:DUF2850 domain-containing protein [Vibrio furnissii]